MKYIKELRLVRRLLAFFIVSLFVSGLTALAIKAELEWLLPFIPVPSTASTWAHRVLSAYNAVHQQAPFLLYGYDWLAFAHFVLALLFVGPYRDPLRNSWVIQFGMMACVLVLPFAFIAGAIRGIPFWWRLIDCSFGVVGFLVLYPCLQKISAINKQTATATFSNAHVPQQAY